MTTTPDLTPGVPRSVPPPIAVAHMNEDAVPIRRGVRRPDEAPAPGPVVAAGRTPLTVAQWQLVRDVAGLSLMGVGCVGGVALAWAYAGPAFGLGLLCLLAVVAGFLLGRL